MVSPGECAEGVEGVELGEAPAVFVVPELLAWARGGDRIFALSPILILRNL